MRKQLILPKGCRYCQDPAFRHRHDQEDELLEKIAEDCAELVRLYKGGSFFNAEVNSMMTLLEDHLTRFAELDREIDRVNRAIEDLKKIENEMSGTESA